MEHHVREERAVCECLNPPDVITGVLGKPVDCHYEKSTPKLTTAKNQ